MARAPHWQRFRNAPAIGTRVCEIADIAPDSMRKITFGEGATSFSMLLIRCENAVTAFVDLCPHQWLPLTFKGDNVLADAAREIVCSNHQARFKTADGLPLSGPVAPDCGLVAVPVVVDSDGTVRIGTGFPDGDA
jgi:nitrite reductase/ring-hydroxylating ferredoxin subunit